MKSKFLVIIIVVFALISCEQEENKTLDFKNYSCDKIGVIKDYTGLDGCGYVIELSDGIVLEPIFVDDTAFIFEDEKPVSLSYQVLSDFASICMVGEMVQITCISELCSTGILDFGLFFNPENYPQDRFEINEVEIAGDCLRINVSYSGGCAQHDFTLGVAWPECGTPPVPPPVLYLCHNGNGDLCEAYPSETISFDLSLLQNPDSSSTTFQLRQNFPTSTYSEEFIYLY